MLSNVGRQILRAGDITDTATVISSIINFPLADSQNQQRHNQRRHRLRRFNNKNADNGSFADTRASGANATSIAESAYDEHLKIDRILYNIFGDMMSIARTTQMEFQTYSGGDDNEKCDAQNDAVENFLATFVHEQSDELIEAMANLNLSLEMSTPSVEPIVPNQQNAAAAAATADNDHILRTTNSVRTPRGNDDIDGGFSDKSSIISIQDVAPIVCQSPMDEEIIAETPTPQRPLDVNDVRRYSRTDSSAGSLILSSNHSTPSPRQSSINKTFSRQTTPHVDHIPSSFGCTNLHTPLDQAESNEIISNESLFTRPTQFNSFEIPNKHISMDDSQVLTSQHNTFSEFDNFSQGFQSFKNDFQSTSFNFQHEFSSKFFSTEQQNDANNDIDDSDRNIHADNDFDEFPSHSFECASFPTEILSQRRQRKRPNLQNIRKNANSSQFSTHSGNCRPLFLQKKKTKNRKLTETFVFNRTNFATIRGQYVEFLVSK